MKTALNGYRSAPDQAPSPPHREWTGRSVVRLLLAAAVLSLVYYVAGLVPVTEAESGDSLLPGIVMFWLLGGLLTITLLALSDRRG